MRTPDTPAPSTAGKRRALPCEKVAALPYTRLVSETRRFPSRWLRGSSACVEFVRLLRELLLAPRTPAVFKNLLSLPGMVSPFGLRVATSLSLFLLQNRQEGFLRHFHLADLFETFFSFRLFGPELAFAGDITAVTFRGHILA